MFVILQKLAFSKATVGLRSAPRSPAPDFVSPPLTLIPGSAPVYYGLDFVDKLMKLLND
jgi:hypothetical protein